MELRNIKIKKRKKGNFYIALCCAIVWLLMLLLVIYSAIQGNETATVGIMIGFSIPLAGCLWWMSSCINIYTSKPSPEKLIKAARKGNLELVNSQLENGTDVNSRDKNGWTPLIWATCRGNAGLIKILLEKGADINAKNIEGRTALMYASDNGSIKVVKMLLEAGVQVDDKDNNGCTALIFASDNGWVETVKMLMEAGAQIDDKDKDEVLTLVNGRALPLSEAQPPFPEFAKKHDISVVVEVKKSRMELEISAKECTIDWGDDSGEDEYNNIKEKNISHRYPEAGSYTITIDAAGLSRFQCYHIDADVTAIYLNNCPQLESLICYLNKLTSLDISRCTALKDLFCGNNNLKSLDLSNNLALNYLSCGRNLLTCLDISNNTQLNDVDCSGNQLSILNVNRNSAIARLQCNNNQLSKPELNRVFNQLPNFNSSYGTVSSWYAGTTSTAKVFFACGDNPGFNSCNKKIVQNKNWLVWRKAMYMPATLAGTPGHWQEDFR
jgi:hypothetical protein